MSSFTFQTQLKGKRRKERKYFFLSFPFSRKCAWIRKLCIFRLIDSSNMNVAPTSESLMVVANLFLIPPVAYVLPGATVKVQFVSDTTHSHVLAGAIVFCSLAPPTQLN